MRIQITHLLSLFLSLFYGFLGAEKRSTAVRADKALLARHNKVQPPSPAHSYTSLEASPPRLKLLGKYRTLSPVPEGSGRDSASGEETPPVDGDSPTIKGLQLDSDFLELGDPLKGFRSSVSSASPSPPSITHSRSSVTLPAVTPRGGEAAPPVLTEDAPRGAIQHWTSTERGAFDIIVSSAVFEAVKSAAESGDLDRYFIELKDRLGAESPICSLVEIVKSSFCFKKWRLSDPDLFGDRLLSVFVSGVPINSLLYLNSCKRKGALSVESLVLGITWLYAEIVGAVAEGAGSADECRFGHSFVYQNRYALPLAAVVIAVSQYFKFQLAYLSPPEFWASFYNFSTVISAHKDTSDPARHDSTLWVYNTTNGVHPSLIAIWGNYGFEPSQHHLEIARALNSRQLAFAARIAQFLYKENYLYDAMTGLPPVSDQFAETGGEVSAESLVRFSDRMIPMPNCEL